MSMFDDAMEAVLAVKDEAEHLLKQESQRAKLIDKQPAFIATAITIIKGIDTFVDERWTKTAEYNWFSTCAGVLNDRSIWPCKSDSEIAVWKYMLMILQGVCMKVRKNWNEISSWPSERVQIILDFLNAALSFTSDSCTNPSLYEDGFRVMAVLCDKDDVTFNVGIDMLTNVPKELESPFHPVNVCAGSKISQTPSQSSPASYPTGSDNVEDSQLDAMLRVLNVTREEESSKPSPSLRIAASAPQESVVSSFCSRNLEVLIKNHFESVLFNAIPVINNKLYAKASLEFIAKCSFSIDQSLLDVIVQTIRLVASWAKRDITDSFSLAKDKEDKDLSSEISCSLELLKHSLLLYSLSAGSSDKVYPTLCVGVVFGLIRSLSSLIPTPDISVPLLSSADPSQSDKYPRYLISLLELIIPWSLDVLEGVWLRCFTDDADSCTSVLADSAKGNSLLFMLLQFVLALHVAKNYANSADSETMVDDSKPVAPPKMRANSSGSGDKHRRAMIELRDHFRKRMQDNSESESDFFGSLFTREDSVDEKATPLKKVKKQNTPLIESADCTIARILTFMRKLMMPLKPSSDKLVSIVSSWFQTDTIQYFCHLAKVFGKQDEDNTAVKAWYKFLEYSAVSPCFPEVIPDSFLETMTECSGMLMFFTRWWLNANIISRRDASKAKTLLLNSVGKKVWSIYLSKLSATINGGGDFVFPYQHAELLILVWRTGLNTETRNGLIIDLLVKCIASTNAARSEISCVATTRALFLAHACLHPNLIQDGALLENLAKNVLNKFGDDDQNPYVYFPEVSVVRISPENTSYTHFHWKSQMSIADAVPLPFANGDEAYEWYKIVLNSFNRADSHSSLLSTAYIQSMWSFLWGIIPPSNFLEELADPSLLLTFGVHDASSFILSWLSFACFSGDGVPRPPGCPSRNDIPLSAHLEACFILMSSLACANDESECNLSVLALSLIVFLYSCLPSAPRFKSDETVMSDSDLSPVRIAFKNVMQSVSHLSMSSVNTNDEYDVLSFLKGNLPSLMSSVSALISFFLSQYQELVLKGLKKQMDSVPELLKPVVVALIRGYMSDCAQELFKTLKVNDATPVLAWWDKAHYKVMKCDSAGTNPASILYTQLLQAMSSSCEEEPALTQYVIICSIQLIRAAISNLGVPKDSVKEALANVVSAISADTFEFVTASEMSVYDTMSCVLPEEECRNAVACDKLQRIFGYLEAVCVFYASKPEAALVDALRSCTIASLDSLIASFAPPLPPSCHDICFPSDCSKSILRLVVSLLLECPDMAVVSKAATVLVSLVDSKRSDMLGEKFVACILDLIQGFDAASIASFICGSLLPETVAKTGKSKKEPTNESNSCSTETILNLLLALTVKPSSIGQKLCLIMLHELVPIGCDRSLKNQCGYISFVFLLEQMVVRQKCASHYLNTVLNSRFICSCSMFAANLLLLLERMICACSLLQKEKNPIPGFSEKLMESTLTKYVERVKKLAPWWQWGAPSESLSADNVPLNMNCTYNKTKNKFMYQPWYYCYTCGLFEHKGACSVCVVNCHRNHDTAFRPPSQFYCDCGVGATKKKCSCLQPRSVDAAAALAKMDLPKAHSESKNKELSEVDLLLNDYSEKQLPYSQMSENELMELHRQLFSQQSLVPAVLDVLKTATGQYSKISCSNDSADVRNKALLMNLVSFFKVGPSALYYIPSDLKQSFIKSIRMTSKPIGVTRLSRAVGDIAQFLRQPQSGRRKLITTIDCYFVVGEVKNVCFYSLDSILSEPTRLARVLTVDVPFIITGVATRTSGLGSVFAVHGLRDCVIFVMKKGGNCEVAKQIRLQLPYARLPERPVIRTVSWLPEGSDPTLPPCPSLMIQTDHFIQIYDLVEDVLAPTYHLVVPRPFDESHAIIDCNAVALNSVNDTADAMTDDPAPSTNRKNVVLFACLGNKSVFYAALAKIPTGIGAVEFSNQLSLPCPIPFTVNSLFATTAEVKNEVCLIAYGRENQTMLFHVVPKKNGQDDGFVVEDVASPSQAKPSRSINTYPVLLKAPKNLVLFGISSNRKRVNMYSLATGEVGQALLSVKIPSRLDSFLVLHQSDYSMAFVLCLTEDCNLVIIIINLPTLLNPASAVPSGNPAKPRCKEAEEVVNYKKVPLRFSKRFFEFCENKADLWSVDSRDFGSDSHLKENLVDQSKYVASPSSERGFLLNIHVTDKSYCIAGVQGGFGFASTSNIPHYFIIDHRYISLRKKMKRWYDFPRTIPEMLKSPDTLTIGVSGCRERTKPVLDHLRVYVVKKSQLLPSDIPWPDPESLSSTSKSSDSNMVLNFVAAHALRTISSYFGVSRSMLEQNLKGTQQLIDPKSYYKSVLNVIVSMLSILNVGDNEDLLALLKETMMTVTRSEEECDWLVNLALLKKAVQTCTSPSSSPSDISSSIRSFFVICRDNPAHIQRFFETESSPFASFASALSSGQSWKGDMLRGSVELYMDAISRFIRYITERNSADQCSPVLSSIADSLCSIVSSENIIVSGVVASLMESFVVKLSRPLSADSEESLNTFRTGIFNCDVCHCVPIVGKHWHCCECPDFDLCDKCHSKCMEFPGGHLASHKMVVHDDGRIISCVKCGKSKLATSWFTCSSCSAVICADCAEEHSNAQHCSGASLNRVTSEQKPVPSFLQSLFQTMTQDYIDVEDPTEELKRYLRESEKYIDFAPGCVIPKEHDGSAKDASKGSSRLEPVFLKISCMKLLELTQRVDSGRITIKDLIPILQMLHAVSVELYATTKDLSVLVPLLEMFVQVHAKIKTVIEPENNHGKLVILFLLFEKSLYESLFRHFSSTQSDTESLKALIQKTVPSDFADTIRQILVKYCFQSGNRPEPMVVDSEDKRDPSQQESLVSILNPALLSENKSQTVLECEPLLPSEYTSQHSDIFEDHFEVLAIALLELLCASLKITKPVGVYDLWKDTIVNGLGLQSKPIHLAVKNFAKLVCVDDVVYRMIRDGKMLDTEVKWLESEAECTHNFTVPMSSSEITRAVDHLSLLTKLSNKRETVWKAYCSAHPVIYKLLFVILESISTLSADSIPADLVTALLSLLSAAVCSNQTSHQDKDEQKEGKAVLSEEHSRAEKDFVLLMVSDTKKLAVFAELYTLHFADANVRSKASELFKRVWFLASEPETKRVLMDLFIGLLHKAPSVGVQSTEFMTELGGMFSTEAKQPEEDVVVDPKMLVSMLRSQNRVLMEHPNASLYRRIGSLMETPQKYLFEPRPCLCCNAASTEYKTVEINSISNQMRATSTARFYRLKNTCIIKSFSVGIQKRRGSARSVKVLNVYVNTRRVADVIDLRDNWDLWKRVQSVHVAEDSEECVITFPHPVSAANVCLEVAELHKSDKGQMLKCPRCSNNVPDRHGVCSHCGENAYQCRSCRYIPYENFDAFFCPQCGTCRDCQFEVSLSMYESFVPEPVESDEDLKKATESLCTHAGKATGSLLRLYDLKTAAASFLYP